MSNTELHAGQKLSPRGRWLLGFWSLFLVCGFTLAAALEPDPQGFGTHQQLGLPPCTIRVLFDVPCPSCGMTTGFSRFCRGDLIGAARANLAGAILAFACAIQIPWCWWSCWNGRTTGLDQPVDTAFWFLLTMIFLTVINWLWMILQSA